MATVLLLGELGKRYGRRHTFDVRNPAEAVRALCANFPGFDKHVVESTERNVAYKVTVGRDAIGEDELHSPSGQQRITIAPVIMGSGGVFKAILGVALIVGSFFINPALGFSVFGQSFTYASIAFNIGLSLALGGVAQLLAPVPKVTDYSNREEEKPNYYFNGPINTTVQGQCVPIGYGRMTVGSAVISAGIDVDDIQA